MICVLYAEYRNRIKNGVPKDDAVLFGGAKAIQKLIPEWPTHDISFTARELREVGFLSTLFAENELNNSALTKDAIIYMENRFQGNVSALLDAIGKLRSIVFPN